MDILKYEQFVKICELSNLTQAAEELNITQSALSHSLRLFEEYYGVPFFYRVKKRLVLTEYGKVALRYSQELLQLLTDLQDELNTMKNNNRSLKIYSTDSAFIQYLLFNYNTSNPCETQIERVEVLNEDTLPERLLSGELDMAVTNRPIRAEGISCLYTFLEEQYVVVNPRNPFYGMTTASLRDFDGSSFYRFDYVDFSYRITDVLFKKIEEEGVRVKFRTVYGIPNRQIFEHLKHNLFFSRLGLLMHIGKVKDRKMLIKLTDSEFSIPYYLSVSDTCSNARPLFSWIKGNYKSLFI